MTEKQAHPFELAGFGLAPFRCVGSYSLPSPQMAEQNPSAYQNALREMPKGWGIGTCAYCGMGLMHNFLIRSADNKGFVVGSECVAKTNDVGLGNAVKVRVARMRNKARREKMAAEREAKYKQWKIDNADRLAAEAAEREAKEAAKQAERIANREKWEFLLPYLQGDGPFVSSMHDAIERGDPPTGRAVTILGEIWAKAHGRRGSQAYNDALDDFETRLGIS